MLELTTTFNAISTAGRAASDALAAARAHVRYVTRSSAAERWVAAGNGAVEDGAGGVPRHVRLGLVHASRDRAQRGGKIGSRIQERAVVSLPRGWSAEDRLEAARRVARLYAPDGSEARALVVVHRDTPGNPHLHVVAVDGRESEEAARARRPDAKRVRRQDAVRMKELGAPKRMRRAIADALNAIANERGLDGVEWRSFAERGIDREPGEHDGPIKRGIERRETAEWLARGISSESASDAAWRLSEPTEPPQAPEAPEEREERARALAARGRARAAEIARRRRLEADDQEETERRRRRRTDDEQR